MDDPETTLPLMNTMTAGVTVVRSTPEVADARDAARAFLGGLPQPAAGPEAAATVVLVVSELVTNALRHGGGTCTLELTARPDGIEVTVHDSSPQVPRMRPPDLNGGTRGGSAGPWSTVSHVPPRSPAGPVAARP